MTITEANKMNILLRYLLGEARESGRVSEESAREAAIYLADRASKALAAGLTPCDVEARWTVGGER